MVSTEHIQAQAIMHKLNSRIHNNFAQVKLAFAYHLIYNYQGIRCETREYAVRMVKTVELSENEKRSRRAFRFIFTSFAINSCTHARYMFTGCMSYYTLISESNAQIYILKNRNKEAEKIKIRDCQSEQCIFSISNSSYSHACTNSFLFFFIR